MLFGYTPEIRRRTPAPPGAWDRTTGASSAASPNGRAPTTADGRAQIIGDAIITCADKCSIFPGKDASTTSHGCMRCARPMHGMRGVSTPEVFGVVSDRLCPACASLPGGARTTAATSDLVSTGNANSSASAAYAAIAYVIEDDDVNVTVLRSKKRGHNPSDWTQYFILGICNGKATMTCKACRNTMSKQSGRYMSHLQKYGNVAGAYPDGHVRLFGLPRPEYAALWTRAFGPVVSGSSAPHPTPGSAIFIRVTAQKRNRLELLYAKAFFASGGHFRILAVQGERREFFTAIFGVGGWQPPSRTTISSNFVGMVNNEVEKEVRAQLNASAGGCLQFDGWTDPAGAQVFAVLYGAPLPFYVTTFRIFGLRESSANLVEKIKEVMSKLWPVEREMLRPPLWHECRNVAAVTDSPNVMVRAMNDMVEAGMFFVAYGWSAHAMSNLCNDVLKLSYANKPLVFCTIVASSLVIATCRARTCARSA
jgi:hypothetical protein